MPAVKKPSIRRGLEPQPQSDKPPPADETPQERDRHKLPHERDESTDDANGEPREVMRQAQRDLENGQVDTDLRSTPGLDAQRRRTMVKGGGKR